MIIDLDQDVALVALKSRVMDIESKSYIHHKNFNTIGEILKKAEVTYNQKLQRGTSSSEKETRIGRAEIIIRARKRGVA